MTLSQTAVLTKQAIVVSAIAIVVGLVSFIGYKIWYAYYLANLPPVEEKPDLRFGLLPIIDFPESPVSSSNFTYSIDTTTGNLPKVGQDPGFEKLVKVYFITKTFATLLSSERSKTLAEKFGITSPPEILSETNYRFKQDTKTLTVNLDTGNFSYTNEATIPATETLEDDNSLVSNFKEILRELDAIKPDLSAGRSKVILLKNEGNTFTPTSERPESTAAQISLWPQSIDDKPIVTPGFDISLVNARVIKSASSLQNYLSLDYSYHQIDTSTFATYPLKNAEQALEELKSGKGIIMIEPAKPNVSITSVSLAYFIPQQYYPYLQPVYVFEGPQFVAYVGAIGEEYLTPIPSTQPESLSTGTR